ncbi:MAG: peptide deformylase [Phycisphaerae bacterium]
MAIDAQPLQIVKYPDPALRVRCARVTVFDAQLESIARQMFELMRAARGVGLAAPQVGLTMRMFVMNPTGESADDLVIVNPEIRDLANYKEAEEGCLSIPELHVQVRRGGRCTLRAQDVHGTPIELEAEELPARIWQHETDHLDGMMIIDRMGPGDKIATKVRLRELEADWVQKTGKKLPKRP